MLLAIAGDTHGDIIGMYNYLTRWQTRFDKNIAAIIHVGDFGFYLEHEWDDFWKIAHGRVGVPIPTWVNPGNHEHWDVLKGLLKEPTSVHNIRLLPDGGITDVLGIKVGSIWGNYSYKSYKNPDRIHFSRRQIERSGQDAPKAHHILRESVEKLKAAGEFQLLITHDCAQGLSPQYGPVPAEIAPILGLDAEETSASGCPGFNELYETGKPTHHFFGHFHRYKVCRLADPTVVCLHAFNYNQDSAFEFLEVTPDGLEILGPLDPALVQFR